MERYEKNKNKDNSFIYISEKEIIGINYYEDEMIMEFNKKRNNPNSPIPYNANPILVDVNVRKEEEELGKNYLYNPILNIKEDDEVFELTELILKESSNNIPGSKMLLNALIFFVLNFRLEEEQNFDSIMKLLRTVYSPYKFSDDKNTTGFDFLMDTIVEKKPDDMSYILYSGFKVLDKQEQLRIAVLLYETLLPFQLKKYNNYNAPIVSCLNIRKGDIPCYMLYLNDYENNIQDRILGNIFAMQNKNINIIK